MTIREVMTDFLNKDYNYIVNAAKKSLPGVINTLDRYSKNDKDCFAMFLNVIGSMISVDNVIAQKEKDLYCELLGSYMSFDDFFEMMRGRNNPDLRTNVNNFVDSVGNKISEEAKFDILVVLLAFAVIDEKLTAEEKEYFIRLFE